LKTITQYREEIKSLKKAAGDISAKAIAENRDLADGEVSLKNEILDKMEELEKIVAVQEREERISARLEAPANTPLTKPGPKATPGIEVGIDNRSKDRFVSFGEQMTAVYRAGIQGGHVDPRLFRAAASGLNETVPSDGGFLVQKDFGNELLQDLFATGGLWTKVSNRVPITGNANGTIINGVDETSRASTTWGGIVVYMVGEAGSITPSRPKFRQITLSLKKAAGLCYATDENLADSAQLENIIRRGFSSAMGFKLDDLLLNGTGAGEPLGFLNAGSLVTVSKETGQKGGTIVAENVIKMYSRMFASSLSNGIWLINQNTLPQLLTMSIAVGTGGVPVYLPPGNSLVNAPGGALMGRPVFPIEQCASVGTLGDIIFVDVANGYVVAEKGGVKVDMSIHAKFDTDESVFRLITRIDGQPVRATALTPYKGGASYTQSHCIGLESRT
jgi:HK97 family phage major capsid protein